MLLSLFEHVQHCGHLAGEEKAVCITKNTSIQIILKLFPAKNNLQIKNSDIFHISAQNIDCGYSLEPPRRGGSNEYPQSMILSRNMVCLLFLRMSLVGQDLQLWLFLGIFYTILCLISFSF